MTNFIQFIHICGKLDLAQNHKQAFGFDQLPDWQQLAARAAKREPNNEFGP
jgi:hypothetical protein